MTIVQFPHPRNEHEYSRLEKANGIKEWNGSEKARKMNRHTRNFIHASGKYVDDSGKLVSANEGLVFWGEWEAKAKMSIISENPEKGFPEYLIEPLKITNYEQGGINTDPCVFGHCFKYSLCRQNNEHGKKMLDLAPGSIILFGSGLTKSFLVDTVFVVSSSKKYNLKTMRKDLSGIKDFEDYEKLVIDSIESECSSDKACSSSGNGCAGSSCEKSDDEKSFYEGATFSSPVNEMYSFVPAKTFSDGKAGFKRLELDMTKFKPFELKDNLTRSQFYIKEDATAEEVKSFWKELCKETEKQGFVKAVEIEFPKSV